MGARIYLYEGVRFKSLPEADLPPYYQLPPLIQPLINKARTLYIDSFIVRKHCVLSIEIIPAFLSDNLTYYIGNSII